MIGIKIRMTQYIQLIQVIILTIFVHAILFPKEI